jgi:DGQHR domain-containing protein
MMPKQSEMEIPLLRCLEEIGGRGAPQSVHSRIGKFFPDLTQADLAQTLAGGTNKWRNRIAWVRQRLVSIGEMESVGRGVWGITEKGRNRLMSPERPAARTKREHSAPSDVIERISPTVSRLVKSEARSRLKPNGNPEVEFENSVWSVVHSLSPNAITLGRDPEIRLRKDVFRPDIVAFFNDSVALVVECKLTKSDAFVANWISQLRNAKRELDEVLKTIGRKQIAYVLAVQDRAALGDHVKNSADQLRVRILDQRDIRYFSTLHRTLGLGVRHLFWGRVAPWMVRHQDRKLPALKIRLGGGHEGYLFSVNAHDLLSRSFVSHRELHSPEEGQVGFQRMLQRKKLSEIADYIKRFAVFPTPIIVAFHKSRGAVFEPLPLKDRTTESFGHKVQFGHIRLPREPNAIQIIDGQHRLYGYTRFPKDERHIVQVLAYTAREGQSLPTMFVDINSKQTKVPSGLLWELYPDIYGDDDPEYYRAVISKVCEGVSRDRLSGHVRHLSSGMRGDISFHALCGEIRRTRLLDSGGGLVQNERELTTVVDAFFAALNDLGTKYPTVNESFVYSNNGVTPFIRVMGRVVRYETASGHKANLKTKALMVDTFRNFFEPVYKYYSSQGGDKLRALRKRIGNAGSNVTEDEITDYIRAGYRPDFPYRSKKVAPRWENAVNKFVSSIANINRRVVESGMMVGWVFKEFDSEKCKKQLARVIDSYDSFSTVLDLLYQEVIEGTGKDPDNRLARLMNVTRIYDLESVAKLNILRVYWVHKLDQVDSTKRQSAVRVLAELTGRANLGGPSELDANDYQAAAIALLSALNEKVLEPALTRFRPT